MTINWKQLYVSQIILAFWLVLIYGLLEDWHIDGVINSLFLFLMFFIKQVELRKWSAH